jgi:hypothetical protein
VGSAGMEAEDKRRMVALHCGFIKEVHSSTGP